MSGRSATSRVARVYDRLAWAYDLYNAPMEWIGGRRRRRRALRGARGITLEVGIGTGRNLEHYPPGVRLVGLDIAGRMLARAAPRAEKLAARVDLVQGDVERLPFPDASFDTVAAACVFCSVADPVGGLAEVRRVVRREGRVLLLEHVRPRNRFLGWLADVLSPVSRRLFGPELNRRTEENVLAAGMNIEGIRRAGVWREIVARPAAA